MKPGDIEHILFNCGCETWQRMSNGRFGGTEVVTEHEEHDDCQSRAMKNRVKMVLNKVIKGEGNAPG